MTILTLRTLGGFEARLTSGEVVEIPIRKGQALLAFLALYPGKAVARSKLAGLLWGDSDDAQARTNLRQTLTVLRKALTPTQNQVFRADRQSIGLDSAGVEVDAVLFQELIARGTPADIETAVSLYRGELLDGLDLADPGFQTWLENERRRFHDLMVGALNALMAHKRAEGARQDAVVLGQRLLTLEPLREDVHCALMVLFSELGQRHATQKQYQRCRELLTSELNVEPAAETEAIYRTLCNNDAKGNDTVEVPGSSIISRRENDGGEKASLDDRSRRPPVATTGVSRGSRRWAHGLGRALMTGGVAVFVWLLPWAPSFELSLPDHMALWRPDVPSLALPSSDKLSSVLEGGAESSKPVPLECVAFALPGELSLAATPSDNLSGLLEGATDAPEPAPPECMAFVLPGELPPVMLPYGVLPGMPEDVTESSGPPSLIRIAFALPGELSLAVPSFEDLLGILERVTGYSAAIVPPETEPSDDEQSRADEARHAMQREADGLWPELANSWDLRAVREFMTHYPEAGQVAEADRRIAFLTDRHREAQAELGRLDYDAGPVDGIWGPSSARAMRAFQSDHGFTPYGVVSEASLDRLKAASREVATPEPQPQTDGPEPEVVVLSPSARDGISDSNRWTASGTSLQGTRVFATATSRGDTLEMMFDVDHRGDAGTSGLRSVARYTHTCTASTSAPVIECWIPGRASSKPGAKVFGTFPRLAYRMHWSTGYDRYTTPDDIVLDFRPEPRLAGE